MGKKYLLWLNLPESRDLLEKIIEKFMQKAFCVKPAPVLVLFSEKTSDNSDYARWTRRKNYGNTCDIQFFTKNSSDADVEGFIKLTDYFISTGSDSETELLEFAKKNNVKVLDALNHLATIFEDISADSQLEDYKTKLAKHLKRNVFEKYPPKKYEYFLFHEGLGESTAFFFWMKKYTEHCKKKILVICFQELRAEMMRLCPYIDVTIRVEPIIFDYISVYCAKKYDIKRVLLAHVSPKITAKKAKLTSSEIKTYGIIGTIRDFLKISPKTKFEKYPVKLPQNSVAKAEDLFKKMNLIRGKTVFVITEGLYFGNLSHHMNFWINFAERLKILGYEVVTNSAEEVIPGCKNIFLSLLESTAFAGLCGNLASVPTGFFEAICALNTKDEIKWQIFYPDENDIFWRGKKVNVDSMIENYVYYLNQYISPNVEFFCNKFPT